MNNPIPTDPNFSQCPIQINSFFFFFLKEHHSVTSEKYISFNNTSTTRFFVVVVVFVQQIKGVMMQIVYTASQEMSSFFLLYLSSLYNTLFYTHYATCLIMVMPYDFLFSILCIRGQRFYAQYGTYIRKIKKAKCITCALSSY